MIKVNYPGIPFEDIFNHNNHHTVPNRNANLPLLPLNIAKVAGQMWKGFSAAEKALYKDLADQEKQRFMAFHPEYRYKPRRSNQIDTLSGATL